MTTPCPRCHGWLTMGYATDMISGQHLAHLSCINCGNVLDLAIEANKRKPLPTGAKAEKTVMGYRAPIALHSEEGGTE